MALVDSIASMPKQTELVDANRRVTPAWQRYLAKFEAFTKSAVGFGAAAAVADVSVNPSAGITSWNTVTGADINGASTMAQCATLVNEIKVDVNGHATDLATLGTRITGHADDIDTLEAKINAILASLRAAGLMET